MVERYKINKKNKNTAEEIAFCIGYLCGFEGGFDMYPCEMDTEQRQELEDVINKEEYIFIDYYTPTEED
jgi:hypothetical protein|tara:strand:- start:8075 stop:8281 length:207 start_codon:yes stop_codon:yes gene_type:complete